MTVKSETPPQDADLPTNGRNAAGVKFSSDCYRTFAGVRWGQWVSFPSRERIAAYRDKGVRCRNVKQADGCQELFVHPDDVKLAASVDETFVEPEEVPALGSAQP